MGTSEQSERLLQDRLEAGLPTLFYLWTPHQLLALYKLTRIQLPTFEKNLFDDGRADYPYEVLEKVAWENLASLAPVVQQLTTRFSLDNSALGSMLGSMETEGLSTFQAACD